MQKIIHCKIRSVGLTKTMATRRLDMENEQIKPIH